jgi:hypothetical protein
MLYVNLFPVDGALLELQPQGEASVAVQLPLADADLLAGLPFFFKQWGGVRKADSGRKLDGETYDEMPCRQPGRVVPAQRVRLALIEDVRRWKREPQPA